MIPKMIVIHHTASSRDRTTLEDVNAWHKVRDFPISSLGYFVGYHWIILGNGQIIQTRQNNEIGAHTIPNEGKIGICLTGNFMTEQPSDNQLNSLDELLNKIKKEYNIQDKDIFTHQEFSRTECPGNNLIKWLNLKSQLSILQKLIILWKQFFLLK